MSHVVEIATVGVRVPLSRSRVAEIVRAVLRAEGVADARVSVTFVRAPRIAALNRQHLGRSGATDVIAFAFTRLRERDPLVGDIYIAPSVARANAEGHGVSPREEIGRLIVHGVLHALGFDHPEGPERTASPMWRRQEELVRRILGATAQTRKGKRRSRAA